jgi:hypothetical protein
MAGDFGPMLFEDFLAVLVFFNELDCTKSARLGSKGESSDAGEQVDVRSFFIHCSN